MELNSQELVSKVSPVIKQAGLTLLSYYGKSLELTAKHHNGHVGFVTQADRASEDYLREQLHKIVPQAGFVAEEAGEINAQADYCWVIDPLDGTTNFINNIPYFCISVALTYKNEPIFGMIYQPVLDELFWATKGGGAYLNGQRLELAQNKPAKYIISVGFASLYKELGYVRQPAMPLTFRQFGALALDLAYIAAGRVHAGLYKKVSWWDIAAGIIIIEQAGGAVTDFQGQSVGRTSDTCLATGGQSMARLIQKMLK